MTDLADQVVVESMPKQEGRNMIMVISPNKRYWEDQAKQRAKAEREASQPEPSATEAVGEEAVPVEASPRAADPAEPPRIRRRVEPRCRR